MRTSCDDDLDDEGVRSSTFAERLVVGTAVPSEQTVVGAVAGVVVVPLLPTALRRALKPPLWDTQHKSNPLDLPVYLKYPG